MGFARSPNGIGDFVIQNPTFKANNDTGVAVIEEQIGEIQIFPNPATELIYFNIQNKDLIGKSICIYNSYGKKKFVSKIDKNLTVLVQDWDQGIYYGVIQNKSFRFIVH